MFVCIILNYDYIYIYAFHPRSILIYVFLVWFFY